MILLSYLVEGNSKVLEECALYGKREFKINIKVKNVFGVGLFLVYCDVKVRGFLGFSILFIVLCLV